jgi:hypothetical protein
VQRAGQKAGMPGLKNLLFICLVKEKYNILKNGH